MSEPINWRDTRKWSWDTNGYAICPCCAAVIYGRFLDLHANMCGAIERVCSGIEAATAACAPQPVCSKCGGTDIYTRWRKKGQRLSDMLGDDSEYAADECLFRVCRACGYRWTDQIWERAEGLWKQRA